MKSLKFLAIGGMAASLACMASAVPAFAQAISGSAVDTVDTDAVVGQHGDWTLKERENWLSDRLQMARDDHSIDGSEFDRVHREIDRIRDSENDMRGHHDGGQLTDNETATLEARLDGVADQIHWMHEDRFKKPW